MNKLQETQKCKPDDIFVFEFALRDCESSVRHVADTLDDQRSIIIGFEDEGDKAYIDDQRFGSGTMPEPNRNFKNNNDAKSKGFIRSFKR